MVLIAPRFHEGRFLFPELWGLMGDIHKNFDYG
jgi:hypothetical protein